MHSARVFTVVVAVAVLFDVSGSLGELALIVTVFVMVPLSADFTVIVTVAVGSLAKVPKVTGHDHLLGQRARPIGRRCRALPVFLGSASESVTPVASSGPLFVTGIV
jgi:hypothetical protein